MRGLIVKGIAGFYYVKDERGVWQCKARGIFKKDGITPYVGDEVEFEMLDEEDGVINEILPRKNFFIRPPISNVDCFVTVLAAAQPKPNLSILDKFLVTAERAGTEVIICINKMDLAKPDIIKQLERIYSPLYDLIEISCETGQGISELETRMLGQKCALAGPSGVGKSTIINKIAPHLSLETGDISGKTKRGKHTTRHVEIFHMDSGGMIFDTPGFTSFELPNMESRDLAACFPEFTPFLGKCKFDNCVHLNEPNCAIRQAISDGIISESRYASYEMQHREIEDMRMY